MSEKISFNTDPETITAVIAFCENNGFEDVFEGTASKMRLVKFLTHRDFDIKVLDAVFEDRIATDDMTLTDRAEAWADFLVKSGLNSEIFQAQTITQNAIREMTKEMIAQVSAK